MMKTYKSQDITGEIEAPLRQWRIQTLNWMLALGCLAGLPAIGLVVLDFIRSPQDWSAMVLVGLYLVLVGLAVLRRADSRIRAWGVLLAFYALGVISFGRGGLVGVGRQYLLVLPVIAIILVGLRSGLLMTIVSLLTMAVFAVLAQRGILAAWIIEKSNPLTLYAWVSEETYTAVLMVLLVALLSLFHRFQVKTLEGQHRAASELEQRVAERTAQLQASNAALEQRKAELEIVNEVGQVLAKELDFQTVIDLIGDKLHGIFHARDITIRLYDSQTNLLHFPYIVEDGRREQQEPLPLVQGFAAHVIRTRQPLVVNQDIEKRMGELGSFVIPGTAQGQSFLGVPILAGDQAIGVITLEDPHENAYPESSVRLLTTFAANLGVSLQNARLFDETKRLLAETEQRARELAIINDVGQTLASKLEMQTIYDLVGDKLRDIFDAQVVSLMTYDRAANLVHYRYLIEKGERQFVPPSAPAGFSGHILKTCEPLLLNQVTDELRARYGSTVIAGSSVKSWLGVPLIRGDQAFGVITLQNVDRENAFSESDVRLLKTLSLNMSVALENVRLFDEERERAAELSTAVAQLQEEIAERKRMEEAVRESERRLADIINFMPDPVLVIDQEGKVIAWNRAIEEMTGMKAQDMLGKGNYEYAIPFYGERRPILIDLVLLHQEEFEKKYAHIKKEGEVLVGETYVPHVKGSGAYLFATAVALRDSKGQTLGAIEAIRDITERKRMEEDLRQAKEAAEAATQAKSAFLAMMSHEIRTPMNAVIGMTGLLLDTPLTPEQREFAETIRTSGDALLTIINDILDFSKIEAGRMELESQPFDLRECVESAVDLLAAKATEKGLNLVCVVESDVPAAIVGDATRLRQVLVNLLGNAVKFTEKGEVVVSVSANPLRGTQGDWGELVPSEFPRVPPSSSELHFSVRDTGIGIPLDRQSRLFQSFSQVDASTTRRFGGTGLGLAISRRLTELMGGTMWVESPSVSPPQAGGIKGGPGSTFHFTIRAEVAQALAPRPYLQGVQPRLEGKRVLIVDDNATNRHILSLQTQAWGMLPRDTGSPREALAWIGRGDPFDVALLDLQMPDMDGIMLAGEIRRVREASSLPIVMLSSLGPREARLEGIELAAYLLKPIKPSQLYNVLVGIFGTAEAVTAVEETAQSRFDAEMGRRHPLSILLAEDNVVNQKLALLVLERLGYRADVAANGIEALQALRRQHYDVVLMDVQMPEMDGLEATRAIGREFGAERRPRVVAMTANVMKEDRDECFAAGMDDFIAKPIQFTELMAALNRCQARAVAEVSEGPSPTPPHPPLPGGERGGVVSAPAPPVLDLAALQRLRSTLGKQADALLPSLIDNFFKDAPKLIADAHRTLEQGQAADLRRAAHTLKSTSATFGAMALSGLARELEYKARDGALEGADGLLSRIEAEYAQAKAALETLRKEL